MSDLIDRNKAYLAIEDLKKIHFDRTVVLSKAQKKIMELPSAQPKRGKWIRDGHHIRCDKCGMYMCDTDREGDRIPTEFCPSCGAKMEGTT